MNRTIKMATVRWAFNCGSWNPTPSEWLLACQCIQGEEKARVSRFMFQRDAKAAMSGRLLLRKVISYALGIPYKDIKLARTDKGKPYLVNSGYPSLSFNISHQGDYAILAADSIHNVGVDVMKIEYPKGSKNVSEFFRHMYRQFTDQEWAKIRGNSDEWQQLAAFYRNWCLKESYVKAIGTGIGFSLQRVDFYTTSPLAVNVVTTDTKMMVDTAWQEDWIFQETMLDDKHCVAVALQKTKSMPLPSIPQFYKLSVEELLDGCQPLHAADDTCWANFSNIPPRPM